MNVCVCARVYTYAHNVCLCEARRLREHLGRVDENLLVWSPSRSPAALGARAAAGGADAEEATAVPAADAGAPLRVRALTPAGDWMAWREAGYDRQSRVAYDPHDIAALAAVVGGGGGAHVEERAEAAAVAFGDAACRGDGGIGEGREEQDFDDRVAAAVCHRLVSTAPATPAVPVEACIACFPEWRTMRCGEANATTRVLRRRRKAGGARTEQPTSGFDKEAPPPFG